jgi:YspA, cpYpsA-related SLOG family
LIAEVLAELPSNTTIVHGGAQGADRIAAQEGQKLGLLIEEHKPDWKGLGKRAGYARNELMAKAGADRCIAFWDGRSSGTAHMMEMAAKYGIPIECIHKDYPNRERRFPRRPAQGESGSARPGRG